MRGLGDEMTELLQGWTITNILAVIGLIWLFFHFVKFMFQLLFMVHEYNDVNRLYHTDHNRLGKLEYEVEKLRTIVREL
jgi:hypothetical protein